MAYALGLPELSKPFLTLGIGPSVRLRPRKSETGCMRLKLALAILMGMSSAALAQGFEIVVPGRPGVPIIINGIDVNYAVLEGDYGLGKGVNNQPTIYGGRLAPPPPDVGHYYPSLGLKPAYGRLE